MNETEFVEKILAVRAKIGIKKCVACLKDISQFADFCSESCMSSFGKPEPPEFNDQDID